MAEEPGKPDGTDDKLLRLIRTASQGTRTGYVRPPDEIISAFLLGTATDEQRAVVLQALERSSEFRRELLGMAKDLQDWTDSETLKKIPEAMAESGAVPESVIKTVSREPIWWNRSRWFTVLPLAAAALLIIIFVLKFKGGPEPDRMASLQNVSTPELVDGNIPPNLLFSNETRSIEASPGNAAFSNADSAALAAIRRLVQYNDSSLIFEPAPSPHASYGELPGPSLTLAFVDSTRAVKSVLQIPGDSSRPAPNQLILWLMPLTQRPYRMYRVITQGDTVAVQWNTIRDTSGVLVLTYFDGISYIAPAGISFHL